MNKLFIAITTCIIWVLVLLSFVYMKENLLKTGNHVLLETTLIDPLDFLRGNYVQLHYVIANIDTNNLEIYENISNGEPFYLVFRQTETYAVPVSIVKERPKEGVFIKVTDWYSKVGNFKSEPEMIHVTYGIEKYFIEEGTGTELEKAAAQGKVDVDVVLGKKGNAIINKVIINQKKEDSKKK